MNLFIGNGDNKVKKLLERRIELLGQREALTEELIETLKPLHLLDAQLAGNEMNIKESVLHLEHTVKAEGIEARYTRGGTYPRWDKKLLEGYAITNPEVLNCLGKPTVRKPSVSVRVK